MVSSSEPTPASTTVMASAVASGRLSTKQVIDLLNDQVGGLTAIAQELGVQVEYVKPHGALYNQAQRQPEIAAGVVLALRRFPVPLLGQPGTFLERKAREHGLRYIAEGFPDRRYRVDGSLVPRSEPDAVLHDPGRDGSPGCSTGARGTSRDALHPWR